jgi:hypothetical protein
MANATSEVATNCENEIGDAINLMTFWSQKWLGSGLLHTSLIMKYHEIYYPLVN